MSDTKTTERADSEKTLSDEMREAAARVREHLLPHVIAVVIPHTAIVTVCVVHEEAWETICRNCVTIDARDRVLARLIATLLNAREPLASWLESAAWVTREHPQDPDYAGLPETAFCQTCNDEETSCVSYVAGALAVARVLNGTAT